MRAGGAALLLLLAAPGAAAQTAEATAAEAAQMRAAWAASDVAAMEVVQPVYGRNIAFQLPRAFVLAYRATDPRGFYIAEYVPEGETVEGWTQMITLTGMRSIGGAKVDDAELAGVMFNRPRCSDWLYTDLGPVPAPTSVTQRTIVIGCDRASPAAANGAAERAVIAVLRDSENVWTVQHAQRAAASAALFDTAKAPEMIAALAIMACGPADTSAACAELAAATAATKSKD